MDYTPIQDLLPTPVKPNSATEEDIVQTYSSSEKIPEPSHDSIDSLLDDLPIDNDLSTIDYIKSYVKLVLIIMVLYFIVSNQASLNIMRSYGGDTLVIGGNNLVLTSTGLLVSGAIMGILFVLSKFALSYVADI